MPGKKETDSDSEAPEELTTAQAVEKDQEIRKVEIESKARASRENKERRRKWAQRKTQRPSRVQNVEKTEELKEVEDPAAMLPSNIIDQLVAREKQTFSSDTEEEAIVDGPVSRKKKQHKIRGMVEPVILQEVRPSHSLDNSMEFLKKRKLQVPRSWASLKNSDRAFRSLSAPGGLL